MKFACDKRYDDKIRRLSNWHKWFAWYPVELAQYDCRWLEKVRRRGTRWRDGSLHTYWTWEYEALAQS